MKNHEEENAQQGRTRMNKTIKTSNELYDSLSIVQALATWK
jgi:hypothetical protein